MNENLNWTPNKHATFFRKFCCDLKSDECANVQIPAWAKLEHSMDDRLDRLCTQTRYLQGSVASAAAAQRPQMIQMVREES